MGTATQTWGKSSPLCSRQLCFGPLRAHAWVTCCSELLLEEESLIHLLMVETSLLEMYFCLQNHCWKHCSSSGRRGPQHRGLLLCWSTAQRWGNYLVVLSTVQKHNSPPLQCLQIHTVTSPVAEQGFLSFLSHLQLRCCLRPHCMLVI